MPIEMAPPSPNLQGFQIPAPQSPNPLQTLAQMGQLRNQNLQQQSAQMQLQQQQLALQSQQGLMRAYRDAGGDLDKLQQIAPQYGVTPDDLMKVQQYGIKAAESRAQTALYGTQADKEKQQALDSLHDKLYNAYQPIYDIKDPNEQFSQLQGINQDLLKQGYKPEQLLQAQSPDTVADTVAHAKAAYTTNEGIKARAEELAKQEEAKGFRLKNIDLEKGQVAQEMQAAADPNTGVPSPKDWAAIQKAHPQVTLPDMPTKQFVDQYTRATVPVEKQPEWDVNTMKAKLGMMGNTEFDQYMAQYAKSLGVTPATLSPQQFFAGAQKYAEDKQDPVMRQLVLGMKNTQESLSKAQLGALPTPQQIDSEAQDLVNGDMAPSQFRELRSGRINYAGQIVQRAKELAQAQGKTFSMAAADTAYAARQKTEDAFATGKEAQMVRSFDNLMAHTQMVDEARKALSQNNLPAIKAIAGAFGLATGGTAESTYDLIADFVKDEAAKAFLPGGGGEGERAGKAAHFERNLGAAQLENNIKTMMGLADAQRAGLERQYDQGTQGKGLQKGTLFSKQALDARDRLLGKKPAAAPPEKIWLNGKHYQYNGSGARSDINNYKEIP